IYDYILTFEQERELVWKASWSPGKVLFCLLRYLGSIDVVGFLFVEYGHPVSNLSCSIVMYWLVSSATTVIGFLCAGLILALRTWVIWDRGRICGAIVGIAWCSVTVVVLTFMVYSMIGLLPDGNAAFPSLPGCGATNTPSTASAALKAYICLAVYEGCEYPIPRRFDN
ncbi:hypothetical protein DACRYDRAFT_59962, partial [Dacryopinax primogenitus]